MGDLILGVGAWGAGSSASLVRDDGEILYCLTEERFSNAKHDHVFPAASLTQICARIRERRLGEVRHVALNGDPALFDPQDPFSAKQKALFLRHKDMVAARFPQASLSCVPYQLCHAAGAFYTSGYDRAAILTIDGRGEADTIALFDGTGSGITRLGATRWPHSLGAFYTAVTRLLGFDGAADDYKVMGMAAYGHPVFQAVFERLVTVNEAGELTPRFDDGLVVSQTPDASGESRLDLSASLQEALGGARVKDDAFTQRHYDIAASLQAVVERCGVELAQALRKRLPDRDALCLSGRVALNGLMNRRILAEAGFTRLFIQPAAAGDGTSLGAALHVLAASGHCPPVRRAHSLFLGLDYPQTQIRQAVEEAGLAYTRPADMAATVASLLAQGHIVARYAGRSEFGPRALGNRSILASPASAAMKDTLNARIKHRESFRPFAPACLAEDVGAFFEADEDAEYMLLICPVHEAQRAKIPAVVHLDGTARVQAVRAEVNPGLHDILVAFKKLTGIPVLINTSFNVNGEAIVETPQDALECFLYTDIDALIVEDMLILREANADKALKLSPGAFLARRQERYRRQFREGGGQSVS